MALNIGVHEKWTAPDNGRTPAQVIERFPGAKIGRAFVANVQATGTDLRPKILNAIQPYLDAGTEIIYVSVKTHLADTRNGLWNTHFQAVGVYLQELMSQHSSVIKLIWWHEPENDMPGTAFAHGFNKVRQNVKLGAPNVLVVYSSMAYQWRPGSTTTAVPADWAAVQADEYASDVYSGRTWSVDRILPEHPGFSRWLANVVPIGSPYSITERGFETPAPAFPETNYPLRNATIEREFEWLRTTPDGMRCQSYVYWNSSGTEEASALRLDPTGEATLAALIAPPEEPTGPTEEELQAAYQEGLERGYQEGYSAASTAAQGAVESARQEGMSLGRSQGRTEGEAMIKESLIRAYTQQLGAIIPNYDN